MFWFWWWYFSDYDSYEDEPAYEARHFKEEPPRELIKEEKIKTAIALILIFAFLIIAVIGYQEIATNTRQLIRALH